MTPKEITYKFVGYHCRGVASVEDSLSRPKVLSTVQMSSWNIPRLGFHAIKDGINPGLHNVRRMHSARVEVLAVYKVPITGIQSTVTLSLGIISIPL